MGDPSSPHKRRRWWIVPLVVLLLITAGALAYRATHLEQWSWFWASRNFIGHDIDATGPNDIYVVGNFILHFDGTRWLRADYAFDTSDNELLLMVACPAGAPTFLGLFTRPWLGMGYETFNVNTVQAYDRTHIYAAGKAGFLQCDGEQWTRMPVAEGLAPEPDQLWVQNPDSIYALDDHLGVLHWNGQVWDVLALPLQFTVNSIGGTPERAVITGSGPTMLLETDSGWEQVDITPLMADIQLHWGSEAGYGLQPRTVWPLSDGRLIIEICEYAGFSPLRHGRGARAYNTRALLCCENGVWSRIDAPEWWEPREIMATPSSLIAYQPLGGHVWYEYKALDPDPAFDTDPSWYVMLPRLHPDLAGTSALMETGQMVMYGAKVDAWGEAIGACRVEYYWLD